MEITRHEIGSVGVWRPIISKP